jgi:hypothetical protein
VNSPGFQLKNLTISNDFDEVDTACSSSCQAVALMTSRDKVVLDNVRLIGLGLLPDRGIERGIQVVNSDAEPRGSIRTFA